MAFRRNKQLKKEGNMKIYLVMERKLQYNDEYYYLAEGQDGHFISVHLSQNEANDAVEKIKTYMRETRYPEDFNSWSDIDDIAFVQEVELPWDLDTIKEFLNV